MATAPDEPKPDWKGMFEIKAPSAGSVGSDTDIQNHMFEIYKDFEDWARHYSTVRMTVATFFITAAFTVLHLR